MSATATVYPALEGAIRAGTTLFCGAGNGPREAPSRLAELNDDKGGCLAIGAGFTLADALHAAEQDLLNDDPVGQQISRCACAICARNALVPETGGSGAAASVLDGHLLGFGRFEVDWHDGRFRLVVNWRFDPFELPPEVRQQMRAAQVPSQWRHGDFVCEFVPYRMRNSDKWGLKRRMVSHPPGQFPEEWRCVEVTAESLGAVLVGAEASLAAALQEDECRRSLTRPV